MWFLNVKFLASIGVAMLIALGGAGLEIWRLKSDVKEAKAGLAQAQKELAIKEANLQISAANLSECNAKIDLQNAKFKELEVKKPDVKKTQEKARSKFESIKPLATQSCEEKLERCERIFDELAR
ncbi:hypothetical protein [uncultured Campylobacter sp.]|uniref:hypothetical protein n=1 Tax=uncultured Campylobacter sp. TaxID=218934 RepID=UPI003211A546